jgi:hypothetical protein
VQTGVGQPLMQKKTSYFDQTCNEFISDWVVMACLGPKPIKVLFKDYKFQDGIDKPQKCRNVCYHPKHQQQSDFLIFSALWLYCSEYSVFIVIALL